jgi:hypothetical protein
MIRGVYNHVRGTKKSQVPTQTLTLILQVREQDDHNMTLFWTLCFEDSRSDARSRRDDHGADQLETGSWSDQDH